MRYSGRTVSPERGPGTQLQYKRLWWHLRHMAVTEPQGATPRFIPRNYTASPLPRERRPVGQRIHKNRSGASAPDSKLGAQHLQLLYTPRMIESRDLAFIELPPVAQ